MGFEGVKRELYIRAIMLTHYYITSTPMANVSPKIKTSFIHCRADPQIKAAAQKVAAHEGKSLSELVEVALKTYIKEKSPQLT